MKTIAIDARMYGNAECTGIGFYIQKLTENLFELDQENQYVLFLREPAFSDFTPPNERVKKVLVTPRWYTLAEQLKLPLEMLKVKFDLIHFPHFNSPLFLPKKSVCTIHDLTPFYFPGHKMKSFLRKLSYQLVFNGTVRKARKIITISNSTKFDIVDKFHIKPNKITVIHQGVDEHFNKEQNYGIINNVKNKFGITKPFLFYVGVWRSHKNIEALIQAFNILKEKYKIEHQLVLGGREDLHYTNVRQTINESKFKNNIITTGFIEDEELPVLYSSASAFVLPSFIEGFGLIAIEAQRCGCPVISTNTSSMPEVLADSAQYFNPNNVNEIAEQIWQVISNKNLQEKLISKGKYNASRFTWQNCAKQTLEIYKKILNSKF